MQLLYPAIWKADLTIFLHQRMDFTPKDKKTGSQKVKRDFVKKVRYCIIFPEKKQGRTIIQNARWWGVTIYQSKDCILKTLCDLQFLERSCKNKVMS